MRFSYSILISTLFLVFIPVSASAAVVLNEAAISPIEERFLELHNTGDSDVDLTGWYIQRKTATGSSFGSLVTKTDFEGKTIKASGYFLISKTSLSNSDIVVDDLTLTESNTIRLRNLNGEDIDQVEWGSVGEGKSYQRTSGSVWIVASPTPGGPNVADSGNTPTTNSQQETSTASTSITTNTTSSGSSSSFPVEPQMFASAGDKKRTATVGGATSFSGKAWGLKKEPIENARMLWNFGDGTTAEGKTVAHTYRYPGTYIVILEASSGYYSASDRVTVEAVSADVVISSVGDTQSSFVELYNRSRYELDLSLWSIRAGNLTFTIPERTFVAAGAKIKFVSEITGIIQSASTNAALYYPNGTLAHAYSPATPSSASPSPIHNSQPVTAKKTTENQVPSGRENIKNAVLSQDVITKKELAEEKTQLASAGNLPERNLLPGTHPEPFALFWWIVGVCALAVVGITSVFFTKRDLSPEFVKNEADAYEIIEEKEDDKIPF